MQKIIFDTDPGIDDAMALLYLNSCEDLELVAITTIHGNADIHKVTNNALYLKKIFDINIPVYMGSDISISGNTPDNYPYFVHGHDGLGDIGIPKITTSINSENASEALIRLSKTYPNELNIIAVGRLTNIALAIQYDSKFSSRIKQIIIMGGAFFQNGNVTQYAEANIYGDPEAAEIVFNSDIKTTMVSLDVTSKTRITMEDIKILASKIDFMGDFLIGINKTYSDNYFRIENRKSFPVHDSSAVAFATKPELFKTANGVLKCVVKGEKRGQTIFIQDKYQKKRICIDVKSKELISDFFNRITKYYS